MRRNQLAFVTIALCLGVLSGHWGWKVLSAESDPSTTANEQKAQSAARLKLMKETAARINVNVAGEGGTKLELGVEPIIRWDNHRSHILDAAAFLWFDRHRPQTIGAMWIKDGNAYFELHSLSPKPIRVTVNAIARLSTTRPGTVWQAVPNAPAPAATRGARLRQMKRMAESFSVQAVKSPPGYEEGSIWHMRLMVQAIHRYSEDAAVDGAIFAFAQGTDPEAYLIFESRLENGTNKWEFAFAAGCIWELHARHGNHEVWFRPKWNHEDTDKIYGVVEQFAIDPRLLSTELKQPRPGR